LLKHGLAVGSACIFWILQVSHAIDSGLVGSRIEKSPLKEERNIPYSPFLSFHATAKKVNTVLFIASTGVICGLRCSLFINNKTALRGANPALCAKKKKKKK
jgi:hypothetical protein